MHQRVSITEYLQSRLGPDSNSAYKVTYYLGRRRRSSEDDGDDTYLCEIWAVAELQPAEAAVLPLQLSVDRELSPEAASGLGKDLKAAIDDVMADRVERMVWKIDDVPEDQVADLLNLPDGLQALAVTPLDTLTRAAGLAAPVASFSSDVAATMLLKPIMEPVKSALHGLEVVGTIIGLLTGAHGLVVTCVKHLIRDELGSMLSDGFGRTIDAANEALGREPSAAAAVDPAGEVTGLATESPRSIGSKSAYQAPTASQPATMSRRARRLLGEATLVAGGEESSASLAGPLDNAGISALRDTVAEDQPEDLGEASRSMSDLDAF